VRVVVTGGTGFIGVRLARRLVELGSLTGADGVLQPIDEIVLVDPVASTVPVGLGGPVEAVAGDVCDPAQVRALIDRPDCAVFHLASVLSAGAEQDFDLALRVNLDGGRNVLEACRELGSCPRVVVASTYATWGGDVMPAVVSDSTKQTPQTTYGTTKAILELLVSDYSRKGFLDGRSARLPTVIVRPGKPNLAASSWVSAICREPLAGLDYTLPVPLDCRHPVAGVRTVVDGLVRLHELPAAALGDDRAVTFPSIVVTAGGLLESASRLAGDRPVGAVSVEPDAQIMAIVETWPQEARFERARELGLPVDPDLDSIVSGYIEDELDQR
jgi:nucleoside-diphosphate-sugar epimerase